MSRPTKSNLFIFLVFSQLLSAFLFIFYSNGFYAYTENGIFQCSLLFSSGGDDEVTVLVFILMIINIITRMARYNKNIDQMDFYIYIIISAFCFTFSLLGSECGQYFATIISNRNPYLFSLVLFNLSTIAYLFWAMRKQ